MGLGKDSQKNSKGQVRRQLLAEREAMTPAEVISKSHVIQEHVLNLDFLKYHCIGLYAPIRNEVRTQDLFEHWLKQGKKKISFPRVVEKKIEFVEIESWKDLAPGSWGILEPKSGRVVGVQELDVVIVPGIAFDEQRVRLGFGKGYYDRLLERYSGFKVGVCYDFQVVKQLPSSEDGLWCDVKCDVVVTEKRIF